MRFQEILRNTYGVGARRVRAAPRPESGGNLFAKITLLAGAEPAHGAVAQLRAAGRREYPGARTRYEAYALSSNGNSEARTVNATRLDLDHVAARSGLSNELNRRAARVRTGALSVIGRYTRRSSCRWATKASARRRDDEHLRRELRRPDRLGADRQRLVVQGAHQLTLGTHDELIHLDGVRRPGVAAGRWYFDSLDSSRAGSPS